MSDKPRAWPNVAKDARDRSAEAAVAGIRALEPLVDPDEIVVNDVEYARRAGYALHQLQTIARLLESVGACTRP